MNFENKINYGARQGWQQFLQQRMDILAKYESAKQKAASKRIKISHGVTVEAELRNWLSKFLPKKYGVTSGYIISQGVSDEVSTPHFDIIIYDSLESPILWYDDNEDQSEVGKHRAIPAEYVKCVIEVKSQLTKNTAKDAIKQLEQLHHLVLLGKYYTDNFYLPLNFFSYMIFIESNDNDLNMLDILMNKESILKTNFTGAVILKSTETGNSTGMIDLIFSEQPIPFSTNDYDFYNFGLSKPVENESEKGKLFSYTKISWAEHYFAKFAFDLIAKLNGRYIPGSPSSLHGYSDS